MRYLYTGKKNGVYCTCLYPCNMEWEILDPFLAYTNTYMYQYSTFTIILGDLSCIFIVSLR